jgi:peptide/nickel transport system permease protein
MTAMVEIAAAQPLLALEEPQGAEPRSYWTTVADRLARDRVTIGVAIMLLLIIALAIFAPWAATHDPLQGSVLGRLKPVGTPGGTSGPASSMAAGYR